MAVPDVQSPIRRVAFQGILGAFSEEALAALWPAAEPVPERTVFDVVRAVGAGDADAGILPVENTVAGGVVAAYDALAGAPALHAVGETVLRVTQCLLGVPGATLAAVESVESHPVALAQCAAFLGGLPAIREVVAADTASAARDVAAARDPRRAAIAGRRAAERYGLTVLAEHIEDRADNQTRFLGVARAPATVRDDVPARTSLLFTTANQPGALLRALEAIAREELNLSKLESRPTGEPWTYRFFADVDHPAGDPRLPSAVATLTSVTHTCRVLGTYARAVS